MAKKRINITIDDTMFKAHRLDGKNISDYINNLLQEQFMRNYNESLVAKVTNQVREQLVADEIFMGEIVSRVSYAPKTASPNYYDQSIN